MLGLGSSGTTGVSGSVGVSGSIGSYTNTHDAKDILKVATNNKQNKLLTNLFISITSLMRYYIIYKIKKKIFNDFLFI